MPLHFNRQLIEWHQPDKRDLPWKKARDPYKIWLSEVILQQTRVEQGTSYYLTFVQRFPNVKVLADAPIETVLKHWEGLGYYSRARNLHAAAREIMDKHKGKFPRNYNDIRALKGVGDYTAAAIASFAFGLPHAVVDGNVYRVLSRVFGISSPIDSTEGKKQFKDLAEKLLNRKDPGAHNQALMDLGSLVCKARNPDCQNCPFSADCKAYASKNWQDFPVKARPQLKRDRHFHYFVLHDGKETLIQQRDQKDIWEKLFQFPLQESKSRRVKLPAILPSTVEKPKAFCYRQVLSHQVIHGYFYEIRIKSLKKTRIENAGAVSLKDVKNFAFPKIINLYLQERLKCLS